MPINPHIVTVGKAEYEFTDTGLVIKDGGITFTTGHASATPTASTVAGTPTLTSPTVTAPVVSGAGTGYLRVAELTFTEAVQSGAGSYSASVTIPAGGWIENIIVKAVAVWDDATSASLQIGDGDDADGYFTAVDVKATDLTAGQTIDISNRDGGQGGVYLTEGTSTHTLARYYSAAGTLTATVTVGAGGGSAGRTRVFVIFGVPTSSTASTFTAS